MTRYQTFLDLCITQLGDGRSDCVKAIVLARIQGKEGALDDSACAGLDIDSPPLGRDEQDHAEALHHLYRKLTNQGLQHAVRVFRQCTAELFFEQLLTDPPDWPTIDRLGELLAWSELEQDVALTNSIRAQSWGLLEQREALRPVQGNARRGLEQDMRLLDLWLALGPREQEEIVTTKAQCEILEKAFEHKMAEASLRGADLGSYGRLLLLFRALLEYNLTYAGQQALPGLLVYIAKVAREQPQPYVPPWERLCSEYGRRYSEQAGWQSSLQLAYNNSQERDHVQGDAAASALAKDSLARFGIQDSHGSFGPIEVDSWKPMGQQEDPESKLDPALLALKDTIGVVAPAP